MNIDTIGRSLIGVEREIDRRDQLLRQLKSWYNSGGRRGANYSMAYFYTAGPAAMREMTVLQSIRADLEKIIAMSLEKRSG